MRTSEFKKVLLEIQKILSGDTPTSVCIGHGHTGDTQSSCVQETNILSARTQEALLKLEKEHHRMSLHFGEHNCRDFLQTFKDGSTVIRHYEGDQPPSQRNLTD